MSREKIQHLKALGAEVVMTRSDVGKGHPAYYQDLALRLASERADAWYANQFANPANPAAHERTTGPEIWAQMDHQVDAVVCGVGSGGTITGLTRFFRGIAAITILADPQGRSSNTHPAASARRIVAVEGIEDLVRRSRTSPGSEAYSIDDKESSLPAELFRLEGVGGSSSGTLLVAAALLSQPHVARARGRSLRTRAQVLVQAV
jgi:cystathionine beta-synthase